MKTNEKGLEFEDCPDKPYSKSNSIIFVSLVGFFGVLFIIAAIFSSDYLTITLLIILVAFALILSVWYSLRHIRNLKDRFQPTKLFLTEEIIRIEIPTKPTFEIQWQEFDGFDCRVKGIPTTARTILSIMSVFTQAPMDASAPWRHLLLKFHRYPKVLIKKVKVSLFHDNKISEILRQLIVKAKKNQKGYVVEKNTLKFYKLENVS